MTDEIKKKDGWTVKSHSYQIADTGDYDGHWEIANGDFALITKEDGDEIESELNKVANSLNELNFIPDDRHKIDLYIANSRIKELSTALSLCQQQMQEKDVEVERLKGLIEKAYRAGYNAGSYDELNDTERDEEKWQQFKTVNKL